MLGQGHVSLSQPPDGAPLRLPATAEEELSGDPKVADAPEMVAEDDAAEAFPGHELADQAPEASEDPVEQLRRCQSRCREVQTGRNEELYAVVADASLLGQRLKSDTAALHRLIKEPLFREWPRPPEEHHDLKPLLLAVQFVFSARTLNEQKRASAIALALESIPGGNLGREAILQELRTKGLDKLARKRGGSRQSKEKNADRTKLIAEADGELGRLLRDVPKGGRVIITAEHVSTKHGQHHFRIIDIVNDY